MNRSRKNNRSKHHHSRNNRSKHHCSRNNRSKHHCSRNNRSKHHCSRGFRLNKSSRSRKNSRDYTIQLRDVLSRYLPWCGLPLMGAVGRWADRMLVMVALLMAMSSLGTLAERFFEARAAVVKRYPSRRRPGKTYAGFMGQLVKRSARLLAVVVRGLRGHVERVAGACWKVGGHLALGVDGSKSDAPRTRANEEVPTIGGQRKSGPRRPPKQSQCGLAGDEGGS